MENELEALIDKHGLSKVLFGLVNVCHEKAAHVAANWQDDHLAKEWLKDASSIEKIAAKIRST